MPSPETGLCISEHGSRPRTVLKGSGTRDQMLGTVQPREPGRNRKLIELRNEYQLPSNDKKYRQKIFALESNVLRLITAS